MYILQFENITLLILILLLKIVIITKANAKEIKNIIVYKDSREVKYL